jgi:hypothetical protein
MTAGTPPSRGQGIGARLKYSAQPSLSVTTLTKFGSRNSASEVRGVVNVAIAAWLCQPSSRAVCAMQTGEINGSSPWTFTTICCSSQALRRATSAMRSVPLACSADVSSTRAPKPRHTAAMRSSSVATMTSLAPLKIVWR